MIPLPIAQFEADNGLCFQDKVLLRTAFVHSSYGNEASEDEGDVVDNERLEFLGDSVLGFVVSEYLYQEYPDLKEGQLTTLRAALVRRDTLARLARQLHLGDFLLLGHGEDESGGRRRPATLCATYEALVGALYLDQGLDAVRRFVLPMVIEELALQRRVVLTKDAKSRLQEWSQEEIGAAPRYRVLEASGPDHAKVFTIEVTLLGIRCGVGLGRSKQEASTRAASHALALLGLGDMEGDATQDLAGKWPVAAELRDRVAEAAGLGGGFTS